MNGWLVKQEPEDYSWADLVKDRQTAWTGVRNFQARNNLRAMKEGDPVLFYHSGSGKEIVGVARVARAAYPDPTASDGDWNCVDLAPVKALKRPLPLGEIKADPVLKEMALVKQSRLSVMPVTPEQFARILKLGASAPPGHS
jgi:predicted RNA-binding protein with PUA-like domain